MKKAMILFVALSLTTFYGNAQSVENLDFVSTFNDGLAAVEKDGQWGFINTKGDIVVNFRNDLVSTKFEDGTYPIFKDGRCLIAQEKDGISYFGY
ncbi:MAG TPA: WG repeat-containing protein, partial [Flavobacteriaceae bacterium]|nr:WG repeat-containing protein [Flavobacteriaceae bacterium]